MAEGTFIMKVLTFLMFMVLCCTLCCILELRAQWEIKVLSYRILSYIQYMYIYKQIFNIVTKSKQQLNLNSRPATLFTNRNSSFLYCQVCCHSNVYFWHIFQYWIFCVYSHKSVIFLHIYCIYYIGHTVHWPNKAPCKYHHSVVEVIVAVILQW